jgi:acyl-CoA hydrolase
MDVQTVTIHHLVKSEDLNHHGTLFAGRSAEWFVEAGFIAAAELVPPDSLVCLKIHGMVFSIPVYCGEIVVFQGKIVHTGRSSMVANIQVMGGEQQVLEGFITFVHVDKQGKSVPHGIVITPSREEDQQLQQRAREL